MNFFSTSSFIVSVIVLGIVLLRCLLVLHPLQHHPVHFGHRKQSSILLQCNLSESEREESQELPEGRKERINEGQTDTSSWCHYLARKSYSLLNWIKFWCTRRGGLDVRSFIWWPSWIRSFDLVGVGWLYVGSNWKRKTIRIPITVT